MKSASATAILWESAVHVWLGRGRGLRLILPGVIFLTAFGVAGDAALNVAGAVAFEPFASLAYVFVALVVIVQIAVPWTRQFLAEGYAEPPALSDKALFEWREPHWRYLAVVVALFLTLAFVDAFVVAMERALRLEGQELGAQSALVFGAEAGSAGRARTNMAWLAVSFLPPFMTLQVLVAALVLFIAGLGAIRLSPLLGAAAEGRKMRIDDCWRMTSSSTLSLILVYAVFALVVATPLGLIGSAAGALGFATGLALTGGILSGLISAILLLAGSLSLVTVSAVSYRHIMAARRLAVEESRFGIAALA